MTKEKERETSESEEKPDRKKLHLTLQVMETLLSGGRMRLLYVPGGVRFRLLRSDFEELGEQFDLSIDEFRKLSTEVAVIVHSIMHRKEEESVAEYGQELLDEVKSYLKRTGGVEKFFTETLARTHLFGDLSHQIETRNRSSEYVIDEPIRYAIVNLELYRVSDQEEVMVSVELDRESLVTLMGKLDSTLRELDLDQGG